MLAEYGVLISNMGYWFAVPFFFCPFLFFSVPSVQRKKTCASAVHWIDRRNSTECLEHPVLRVEGNPFLRFRFFDFRGSG